MRPSFRFNPFGGLTDQEIGQSIVPRACCDAICDWIESGAPGVVELVGPKGRGKTTHLVYLQALYPKHPIFFLSAGPPPEIEAIPAGSLVFIDSIHHLPLGARIRLYRRYRIVLTTHLRRAWEYRLAGVSYRSFSFRGLGEDDLVRIIERRVALALNMSAQDVPALNRNYLRTLLRRYGDDHRGILNQLFDEFQTKSPLWYEQ